MVFGDGQSNSVFTRSSKRPALARVFWIHLLEVCWTFAGSCKQGDWKRETGKPGTNSQGRKTKE